MIKPSNRNILVEVIDSEQEQQSDILVPNGSMKRPEYSVGKTLARSIDCKDWVRVGQLIIFPSNMIQEIEVNGERAAFIAENYVLGYVEE